MSDIIREYERKRLAQADSWREIACQVPYLKFRPEWEIRVTPPFGSVDARFRVRQGEAEVSVYLDWYANAGYMEEPYWEIYPIDGDCERFLLNETEQLIDGIARSIAEQLAAPSAPIR